MTTKAAKKPDVETTAVVAIAEQSGLSVQITDRALEQYQKQINSIKAFVKNNLTENVDYGKIPGTPKNTLLKPGAEKLQKLFMLGTRIVNREREIDRQSGFAMFSYTVEVYSLQNGNVICQCEGSANTEEKKNRNREVADLLNTLQKMAQKRAFVGAIIAAVGASDFFTQDMDDTDTTTKGQAKAQEAQQRLDAEDGPRDVPTCAVCNTPMRRTAKDDAWGCKNWSDGRKHDYLKD